MISFYPGPSRVYDEIPKYVKDAFALGIMSINHRSDDFVKMSEQTIKLLKQKLNIPKNYTVFFTSSATECWEIIAQSIVTDKSYHLYNGSFGQKWFDYTKRIRPFAEPLPFNVNEKLDAKKLIFDLKEGIICITQNETSNGTQVTNATIRAIKKNNPSYLVAIDATSSMAGIDLDFKAADIWLASVQKCFGLPAGLGIMVCSPQTIERVKTVNEKNHYNSLPFMIEMMDKWQTPFTPNVLGIYLLMRVLENMDSIKTTHDITLNRYTNWVNFLKQRKTIQHFVTEEGVQSHTVIPVTADENTVSAIKKSAKKEGILLGEGYGTFKPVTFRIANFPALKDKEIKTLMKFLEKY
ncbi:aminotransferase class V-fold PLP-dependent enzyme [Ohtaekwangia koreensis]|uniref:phosphoserine transaminase n=1 Tax=Ohtaekwangia koreensis TaxID=688867 RepID=A0A1T5J171_9BACT|nr:aminotransferase class V-fold PLP-dependent enzyme [Ohtaekwangia koreensis]SKC45239.1 phosphoserine aminotransferase [Ohtaekwangia koreensis]